MVEPDLLLTGWFITLSLLGLLVVVPILDIRQITRYEGRHVRVPGQHRQDPKGAGWWWQPPDRTWTSGYGRQLRRLAIARGGL